MYLRHSLQELLSNFQIFQTHFQIFQETFPDCSGISSTWWTAQTLGWGCSGSAENAPAPPEVPKSLGLPEKIPESGAAAGGAPSPIPSPGAEQPFGADGNLLLPLAQGARLTRQTPAGFL